MSVVELNTKKESKNFVSRGGVPCTRVNAGINRVRGEGINVFFLVTTQVIFLSADYADFADKNKTRIPALESASICEICG